MIFAWHHWAILGITLVISELVIPTLVLVWFGLGALAVALLLALVPGLELIPQLLIWCATSIAFVVLWFKIFQPLREKTLSGRSSAEVIGEVGLLVSDVDQFQKGKVRFQRPIVGSDIWECIADVPIITGSRVKVTSIEGTILKIQPTEKTS